MRSQSVLGIATRRSSAMSLMIVLSAMFFASCKPDNPTQTPPTTPSTTTLSTDPPPGSQLGGHHDIPPEIVVDVGSFSIDTKEPITNVTSGGTTNCSNTCIYKENLKDVKFEVIKVIRADDGAILYQNFYCAAAQIEFTTHDERKITIKGVEPSGQKKYIKVDSSPSLTVETFDTPSSPPRRKQKLKAETLKIKNVTIKNPSGTLFSYFTPEQPGMLDKYRVVIKLEIGGH